MHRLWIVVALLPLAALAAGTPAGANGCTLEGGETKTATMIPVVPPGRSGSGTYLYAGADGGPGVWFETNDIGGLQITPHEKVCTGGEGAVTRIPMYAADDPALA